jgi:hypothetical protein
MPVLRLGFSPTSTKDLAPLPESTLQVQPNPVREQLRLRTEFEQPTEAAISILGPDGRVVILEKRQLAGTQTLDYPAAQFPNGIYLARIATRQGSRTVQFVVQR